MSNFSTDEKIAMGCVGVIASPFILWSNIRNWSRRRKIKRNHTLNPKRAKYLEECVINAYKGNEVSTEDVFVKDVLRFADFGSTARPAEIRDHLIAVIRANNKKTIFARKDKHYRVGDDLKLFSELSKDDSAGMKQLFDLVYAPTRSSIFAEKVCAEKEWQEFFMKLRGDQNFVRYLDDIIEKFVKRIVNGELVWDHGEERIDDWCEFDIPDNFKGHRRKYFEVMNEVLSNNSDLISREVVDLAKKIASIPVTHSKEMYSDWARSVVAHAKWNNSMSILNLGNLFDYEFPNEETDPESVFKSIQVRTESSYFPFNITDDERNLTCVLGPGGVNKKVSLLYELDPHMGVLRLVPSNKREGDFDVTDQRYAIGIAYVFQCVDEEGKFAWLIDGVDVGPAATLTGRQWEFAFFQGICAAAKDRWLREKPEALYFNLHTKNPNNDAFNRHVQHQGRLRELSVKKVGGNKALIKAGLRKTEHYIEAFHYSSSSVWTSSCEGIVEVAEVEL